MGTPHQALCTAREEAHAVLLAIANAWTEFHANTVILPPALLPAAAAAAAAADWLIVEDDILAAIRTAYNGADSFHNSNRITFKRIPRYRQYIPASAPTAAHTGLPNGGTGG